MKTSTKLSQHTLRLESVALVPDSKELVINYGTEHPVNNPRGAGRPKGKAKGRGKGRRGRGGGEGEDTKPKAKAKPKSRKRKGQKSSDDEKEEEEDKAGRSMSASLAFFQTFSRTMHLHPCHEGR